MYRCEQCGVNVGARRPKLRIVTETRPAEYPERQRANALVYDEETGKKYSPNDPGGFGWERVKDLAVCQSCQKKHEASGGILQ